MVSAVLRGAEYQAGSPGEQLGEVGCGRRLDASQEFVLDLHASV